MSKETPRVPAKSSLLLWAALALPGVYFTFGFWQGSSFYGEYIHRTGDFSVKLLIVTMAVTPLSLVFGNASWVCWLRRNRRYLGVACFCYALLHTAAYLLEQPMDRILRESTEIPIGTGWLALSIMLPLALTSNDLSLRLLRRNWKLLHRLVYAVAALTFLHWVLTAFDPVAAYWHLGVLAGLECIRLGYARGRRSHR